MCRVPERSPDFRLVGARRETYKGGELERGLLPPLSFVYTGLRTSVKLLNRGELRARWGLIVLVAVGTKLWVSAACAPAETAPRSARE